ncbi:flagellin [Rhodobacter sp. KR11]|uniref:flagellin n=1 Tax=Rhodobacter sp. KR11 TaxID=2974588 RepID=UPI002222AA55|nr:flagellin [Rhodobacter sp. KR11]MCW1919195.1 flagellin [Rhodobacter sp. KR11]
MSSILTNTSAMVALQTMKSINMNLSQTTSEISTGKRVGSAKDNAAVWAISKVMESDVSSFKGISDSLALGSSTVAVARQAAETVTTHLTSIKNKIVAAQNANESDRGKIETDITALKNQIDSVVNAAQFNGMNLVKIDGLENSVEILASLDRTATGTVSSSSITVAKADLQTGAYVARDVLTSSVATNVSAEGDVAGFFLDSGTGTGDFTIATPANFSAGDKIAVTIGSKTASYTIRTEDLASTTVTPADVIAVALKQSIESLGIEDLTVGYDSATATGKLELTNGGAVGLAVGVQITNKGSGGLGGLSTISVAGTDLTNARNSLANIEGLLKTAIDASAAFGSSQTRIETQQSFVGKLVDSMKAGIGSLIDADMEEASARLQALQVQQQLSTQALSIANQQPQALLSLFR